MTQNKPNEDLRVRRTRKLIMQALIELTIEKGFVELTVQDIAERAMVNRATFYRHYLDKYDLLEKYMNEVYEMTAVQTAAPSPQPTDAASANPTVGVVSMLEHVQRNADFYRVMLGAKGDPAFAQRIQQYSEMRLRSLLTANPPKTKPNSPPLDLCLRYVTYAGVGVIAWWLNEGQAHSPEQVAAWLSQLNQATLAHIFGDIGAAKS